MKIKNAFTHIRFATFLLICVIILTLSYSFYSTARYTSDITGNSNVSIAKWNVSVSPITQTNTFNAIAGNTVPIDYTVRVTSTSQVSSNYSIVVTNIPTGVKVSIDDGTEQIPVNNAVTFSNAGTFNIGDANNYRDHKLTFSVPIESNAVNNNNINIQVVFSQKE